MNYFAIDPILQVIALCLLAAFVFYAVKLVRSFRTGMLAKSWKYVTWGALVLILAEIPILAVASGPLANNFEILFAGQSMRFFGILLITLGFREQCRIWRPSRPAQENIQAKAITS